MVEQRPNTERFLQHCRPPNKSQPSQRYAAVCSAISKSPARAELSLSESSTFISDYQYVLEINQSKADQIIGTDSNEMTS